MEKITINGHTSANNVEYVCHHKIVHIYLYVTEYQSCH